MTDRVKRQGAEPWVAERRERQEVEFGVAERCGRQEAERQEAEQQEAERREWGERRGCQEREEHKEIGCKHSYYPEGLHRVEQPPERLYLKGAHETLALPGLAIVGARKATPYGLKCARRFARLAAARGIVVVSGGAIGCDQAAHRGALEIGGRTIVVLGCGADVVYPRRGRALFAEVVAEGGTIVSEAPWGAPPSPWGFRRRNRLIAGIARATLIVEAGLPSGTFSTADATLAQGKEVLAVPGSIFARESKGVNHLILHGALPIINVERFEDALNQLFGRPTVVDARALVESTVGPGPKDSAQAQALAALVQQPLRAEELLGICGDEVTEVIRCLSALELVGLTTRLRDGRYALTNPHDQR
jgi:DNA processing protein